jgi:hypothetical protein
MLVSHTEKTNDCNAASKFKVSETNTQWWRPQKKKIQTPPKNVSVDAHMVISKESEQKKLQKNKNWRDNYK